MTQDVYVDLLFLINFSMDYLCLYVCAKILHRRIKISRILPASVLGGVYSVASLFIQASPPLALAIDVGVCMLLCAVVFAEQGRTASSTLLCTFLFVGISMMTGGCMTAIFNLLNRLKIPLDSIEEDGISTYLFAILAAISGLITLKSGKLISKRASVTECTVTLTVEGKRLALKALSDSGNLVKDPLTGKPVVLIDRDTLASVCDVAVFDRYAKGEQAGVKSALSLRLIPIATASGRSVLVAAKAENLTAEAIDKRGRQYSFELDALFAPADLQNHANGYKAIIPAEILKL